MDWSISEVSVSYYVKKRSRKISNLLAALLLAHASGPSPPIAAGPGPSPAPSSHLIGSTGRWSRPEGQDITSSGPHRAAGY